MSTKNISEKNAVHDSYFQRYIPSTRFGGRYGSRASSLEVVFTMISISDESMSDTVCFTDDSSDDDYTVDYDSIKALSDNDVPDLEVVSLSKCQYTSDDDTPILKALFCPSNYINTVD